MHSVRLSYPIVFFRVVHDTVSANSVVCRQSEILRRTFRAVLPSIRASFLFCASYLKNIFSAGDEQEVLPLVLRMASDPVPNIRFNVSKTLEKMAPRLQVRCR